MRELNRQRIVGLARSLVRQPSVLGNEEGVARLVRGELEARGFEVEADRVGNVIGVVRGSSGPVFLFDAHMDTVDVSDESEWRYPPFEGRVEGGRLCGRGSSDMKGALAAMIEGLGSLTEAPVKGTLLLCASVGEESTEGTALRTVLERWNPDQVCICEPTALKLAIGGRGRAEYTVDVLGKAAHASSPELGLNAVVGLSRFVMELERVSLPRHPRMGTGTLCVTDVVSHPYPAHSVVPYRCTATLERRLLPGDTREGVLSDFEECGEQAKIAARIRLSRAVLTTYTGARLESEKWYPPWEISPDSELARRGLRALTDAGIGLETGYYSFCTNAALTAGRLNLPTFGFGPSSERLAHTVDEWVDLEQLFRAAEGYRALAAEWLLA